MKKGIIALVIIALLLLVACGPKMTGKRVAIPETTPKAAAPTGAVSAPTPVAETGKTAAETLKELQTTGQITEAAGPKSGNFYPDVNTTATGKEALAAKTDALMRQSGYIPSIKADKDLGLKYHQNDGDPTNLPDKYTDSSGD